jgi:hypothetical protein
MFARLIVYLIFFLGQAAYAFEHSNLSNLKLIENMHEKIRALDEDKNFTFFDLELSASDLEFISQFKIESSGVYNRLGNLSLMRDELPVFLRSTGSNNELLIQKVTKIIFEIASSVSEASNKETACVSVRVSTFGGYSKDFSFMTKPYQIRDAQGSLTGSF